MQLELANYDRSASLDDLNRTVFIATTYKFDAVAIPPHFIAGAAELAVESHKLNLISPVDFPYGMDSNIARMHSIAEAYKRGARIIELCINNSYIVDKKYKHITEDIVTCITYCKAKDIELRALVEYRLFDDEAVIELSKKLYSTGIRYLTLSTGTMVDDPIDNILIAKEITTKTKLKVISNSFFRNLDQVEVCKKANLYGMRFNSSIVVEKLFKDSKNGV